MNYLVLHGLQHYAETTGPYQALSKEIYLELRRNVVENMQKVTVDFIYCLKLLFPGIP